MAISLTESRTIRELNKVNFTMKDKEFEAYLKGGLSFGISSNMSDMTKMDPGVIATLAANALWGIVPAFDMPRWFSYKGSNPITFNVECYLKLQKDFATDVVQPFMDLMEMTLPKRGQSIAQKLPIVSTVADLISGIPVLQNLKVEDTVKQIYILDLPKAINPQEGLAEKDRMSMRMGKATKDGSPTYSIKFGEVFITGIAVAWDRLLVDRGYPERLDLVLTVETLRCATTDMMKSMFFDKSQGK